MTGAPEKGRALLRWPPPRVRLGSARGVATLVASIAAMLLAGQASASGSSSTVAAAAPALYKNCTTLNKKYPHGVGRGRRERQDERHAGTELQAQHPDLQARDAQQGSATATRTASPARRSERDGLRVQEAKADRARALAEPLEAGRGSQRRSPGRDGEPESKRPETGLARLERALLAEARLAAQGTATSPELSPAHLRIEERELEAGGVN